MLEPSDQRLGKTAAVGELSFFAQFMANPQPVTAERQAELERHAQEQCREMLRGPRRESVRLFFGEDIMDTDWNHPDLQANRDNIERVLAWQYGPRGLLIAGRATGTGKSRALAALTLRVFAEELVETSLWHSQELFAAITQRMSFGRDNAREFIEGLGRMPLVVIEDFGQEATAAMQEGQLQQWFFRMLDLRSAASLPCLITTNHTAESLAEKQRSELAVDPLIRRLLKVAEPVRFRPGAAAGAEQGEGSAPRTHRTEGASRRDPRR
jgi:DNA replication protein DnaC